MKKLRIIALLLAIVMTLGLLASCGDGGNTDATEATTADDVSADDVSTQDDAPAMSGKVKVIDISLTDEQYAFGVNKDDAELLAKANEYIAQVKSDGTLDEIISHNSGEEKVIVESAEEDSSKDQLIVATNAAFPPFEATEGDAYTGIDMELAKGLADYLNKELVIKNIEFDSILSTVNAGQADIAIAGLTINPDREEMVTFTDSYYTSSQVLIVHDDDTNFDECTSTEDVVAVLDMLTENDKIGVQKGTTGQFYVEGDEDWGFDGLKAECVTYPNGALAVENLLNGNVYAVIIDKGPALSIAASVNG